MIRSRTSRLLLAALTGLLTAGAVATPALAAPAASGAPPSPAITIRSVDYDGTGCPPGSVATSTAGDGTSFTYIYDRFDARSGPGQSPTAFRKDCRVTVTLSAPTGWAWGIGEVTQRGYVAVPSDVDAAASITASVGGRPWGTAEQRFNAGRTRAVTMDYALRAVSPVTNVNWSSCGGTGTVTLNTQVRLAGTSANQSQITVDSLDGKVTSGPGKRQDAKVVWTRCG